MLRDDIISVCVGHIVPELGHTAHGSCRVAQCACYDAFRKRIARGTIYLILALKLTLCVRVCVLSVDENANYSVVISSHFDVCT